MAFPLCNGLSLRCRSAGRTRWTAAAGVATLLFASMAGSLPQPAAAQPKPAATLPPPAVPDANGTLVLIRTVLLALDAANATGNYTVLRDLGAQAFRDGNTAARLAEIFASQRAQKLDLSEAAVTDPQLTLPPQVEASGMMHIAGVVPLQPQPVRFEMLFAPGEGRWRLFGLAVNVGAAAPAALPNPPPAAAAVPPTPVAEAPRPGPEVGRRPARPAAPKPKRPPRAVSKPAAEPDAPAAAPTP